MAIYKLYGAGSADAMASFDVRTAGKITSIWGYVMADLDADNEQARVEVSFASTSGFGSNDTNNSIFGMGVQFGLLTSGAANNVAHHAITDLAIPVDAGERIYLHGTVAGTTQVLASIWMFVEDGEDRKTPVRRR